MLNKSFVAILALISVFSASNSFASSNTYSNLLDDKRSGTTSSESFSEALEALAKTNGGKEMLDKLEELGVEFKPADADKLNTLGFVGAYDAETDTIYLNQELYNQMLENGKIEEQFLMLIMHEAQHAVDYNNVDFSKLDPKSQYQFMVMSEINAVVQSEIWALENGGKEVGTAFSDARQDVFDISKETGWVIGTPITNDDVRHDVEEAFINSYLTDTSLPGNAGMTSHASYMAKYFVMSGNGEVDSGSKSMSVSGSISAFGLDKHKDILSKVQYTFSKKDIDIIKTTVPSDQADYIQNLYDYIDDNSK